MEGAYEFEGIVTDIGGTSVHNGLGTPVMVIDPLVTIDIPPSGTLMGIPLAPDVDDAREYLGRRVRVTVEVGDA